MRWTRSPAASKCSARWRCQCAQCGSMRPKACEACCQLLPSSRVAAAAQHPPCCRCLALPTPPLKAILPPSNDSGDVPATDADWPIPSATGSVVAVVESVAGDVAVVGDTWNNRTDRQTSDSAAAAANPPTIRPSFDFCRCSAVWPPVLASTNHCSVNLQTICRF